MFPSTPLPKHLISTNLLHFPRRMLLHSSYIHPKPASPPTNSQIYPSPTPRHGSSVDANVVMIFSVLLCLLIFSICVNCLIRCMLKCLVMITTQESNLLHKGVISSGVDKRALKTFPVVKYSKEVKIRGLSQECVICLSEFKKGERVRILPKCHHGFHVKCIDKWLSSQSSCPTCRQSLVDTCQKIIGCDDHPQDTSSPTSSESSSEIISISIVPLEREDMVRN